jgi:hypothetical protein
LSFLFCFFYCSTQTSDFFELPGKKTGPLNRQTGRFTCFFQFRAGSHVFSPVRLRASFYAWPDRMCVRFPVRPADPVRF